MAKKPIKIFCLVCIAGTLLLLFFGYRSKAPSNKAEEIVRNYLSASASLNLQEVKEYLTGQALSSAEQNIKNGPNKVTIVNEKTKVISQSNNFAIVSAETVEMPGHNRWNYLFHLQQTSGKLLIYKVEFVSPDLPGHLNESSIPGTLSDTIKSYVSAKAEGEQVKALQYLTGVELVKAQREEMFQNRVQAQQKTAKPHGSVTDFQLTSSGAGDGYHLVHATYTVSFPGLQPIHKDVLFTAADASGAWKIVSVDQVSGE
ncbi:hypothetical protein Psch_03497 [Pelotomaculum schinkii]|uniref:Uncharacterized protein n=1 Tax=Pelotomaculum schinkii TaxID=78350 RepID=A0A4Y7R732_9FIRM|nr:hypothetical protein [Pelotomaculum schinkii]TEB04735.1 hypothetical protein Psch_03497 [Pelotomaculum schinkii]